MKLEEIDDAAPAIVSRGIEPRGDQVHHFATCGHLFGDQLRGEFHQHDGRCLQGLEKSCREPDGDAIALPECFAISGANGELPHRQILACRADVGAQLAFRVVIGNVAARVDVADTTSRGKPDVPDPSRGLRRGNRLAGNGRRFAGVRHLHRQRAVTEQHVATILERHAESFTDQQRLEAGAIDEQVTFDLARLRSIEAADVAVVGEIHLAHVGEHVPHTRACRSNAPAGTARTWRRRDDRSSWRRLRTRRSRWSWAPARHHKCGLADTRRRRSCARLHAPASAARG